jgi:hypothetical protein
MRGSVSTELRAEERQARGDDFSGCKALGNSFVSGPDSAPQLFLFVNMDEASAYFSNRVTYELHHVALDTRAGALYATRHRSGQRHGIEYHAVT